MAELSYQALSSDRKSQSIIITGESGAGKTESTKIVLRYLANIQKKEFPQALANPLFDLEDKILYTNPVLEAFGNAKTVRNNNSSRFGKFIQIYFDQNQAIYSAEISNYLLEKSRLIMQSPLERNYHIFHMLLSAAPEETRRKYRVSSTERYPYMHWDYPEAESFVQIDKDAWEEMNRCMVGLQFTSAEKDGILRIVGSVLNLSKVELEGGEDHCRVKQNDLHCTYVSELLGIAVDQLESLMCTKSIIDPNTKFKIVQRVGKPMAEYNRETFSKILYDKLFDWIVSRVNVEIRKPLTGPASKFKSIGLLDIFGFEIFEVNSFEQLCINFTNEKLQQHFNDHMFKLEQKEYLEEKIDFNGVEFVDNLEVINLIEKRPKCIFSLLDEQCAFASGTDSQLWEKLQTNFKTTKGFLQGPKTKKNVFGITHFAGDVFYEVTNFLDKNKNSKNKDMDEVMANALVPFVTDLFNEKAVRNKPEKLKSVSGQFLDQLEELIKGLNESASLYIRCIKPNRHMIQREFESELVCKQLRCAGMLEAIRIRRLGFPVRRTFDQFCNAYKLLLLRFSIKETNKRTAVEVFLRTLDKEGIIKAKDNAIQVGKTKIFMKEHIRNLLEVLLEKSLSVFATRIQKAFRRFRIKKRLEKLKVARVKIQRWCRGRLVRIRIIRDRNRRIQAANTIKKFFKTITFFGIFKRRLMEMKLGIEPQKRKSAGREMVHNHSAITAATQKKNLIKEKFSSIIQQSCLPTNDEEDEEDLGFRAPVKSFSSEDLELHPKYIQLQLENNKLKQELEMLRSRPPSCGISHETRLGSLGLNRAGEITEPEYYLDKAAAEKEGQLKVSRVEVDVLKAEKEKKVAEIVRLQKELEKNLYDESLFNQLEQVNSIISQKSDENVNLKKQIKELKHSVKLLRESAAETHGSEAQQRMIEELQQRLEYMHNQSIMRESQLSLDEGRIERLKKSTRVLREEAECCRELVHNLVKLLKFKGFELMIMQKQYVDQEKDDRLEELIKKYQQMRPQEQIIKSRMEKGMAQLADLQEMEAELEMEEEEDDAQENMLPPHDY